MLQTAVLLLVLNAPAPLPKAPPPPAKINHAALIGDWDCKWGGTLCVMSFRKDGVYGCRYNENNWYGSWELNGDTLTIREWLYESEHECAWTIKLEKPHSGQVIGSKTPFHLPFSFILQLRGTLILGPKL